MKPIYALIVLSVLGLTSVAIALPYVETTEQVKILADVFLLSIITLCVSFGVFVGWHMRKDADE